MGVHSPGQMQTNLNSQSYRPKPNLNLALMNVQCMRTKCNLIPLFESETKPNVLGISEH